MASIKALCCVILLVLSLLTSSARELPAGNSRQLLGSSTSNGSGASSSGSASSGSSSGVSASGAGSSGSAGSSSSSSVVTTQASAVANAIANACNAALQGFALDKVVAASLAASDSSTLVFVNSNSWASTSGHATACAYSGASATAVAQSFASAVANAFALVFSRCSAVVSYVNSADFAATFVSTCASAGTAACSLGNANANAQISVLAGGYSLAVAGSIAKVFSLACQSQCAGCSNLCIYGTTDPAALTFTFSNANTDEQAFESALAGAAASGCAGGTSAVVGIEKAFADVCGDAWGYICGSLSATSYGHGVSFACNYGVDSTKVEAYAEAYASIFSEAWTRVFGQRCANTFATVSASGYVVNYLSIVETQVKAQCTNSNGQTFSYANIETTCINNWPEASALASAFSAACQCSGRY